MSKSKQNRMPRKRKSTKKSAPIRRVSSQSRSFPIVGVGASAGGLEAFTQLLHHLPQKTGMGFVLVQHLDPTHGSALEEILARTTKIPVKHVTDGVAVQPDNIYVIPANADMSIKNGVLRLTARALTRGQHMPIDHFFHSLADERGNQAIAVILSGTASDGTLGCGAVKAAGGITFAQDESSAKYSSMPRSAIAAGYIDFVLAPKEIAQELTRIGRHPYIAPIPAHDEQAFGIAPKNQMDDLLAMVHDASGVDFTHYKQSTVQRRIRRRMVLHRLEKLKDYLRYIKANPTELDELYRDILIHVTGFFRDPEAFRALHKQVFPNLFENRNPKDAPVRIWVPGCSTGEEVYSIAIVLLEFMAERARRVPSSSIPTTAVQIFATDISDSALDRARDGSYTQSTVAGVSPERLRRFFLRSSGGYQINKTIRDMCIFAKQNLTKDPPFSNLDLVSCRNLLIYLGPVLQKRVIPTIHYALKPSGYLMLGESESLGELAEHFTLVDKKHKIYQKKRTATRLVTYFSGVDHTLHTHEAIRPKPPQTGFTIEKEVERLLMNRFVPASIVVNEEMEIVQFRGKTGAYLEPAAGHPTFSLSKMAREGLLVDLRAALLKAKKSNATVRKERVRMESNGGTREVNLEVIPVRGQAAHERFYVVVFQDVSPEPRPGGAGKSDSVKLARKQSATSRENEGLTHEVSQLREQLRSLIEDHETTMEEFKAANEEVLSANEELQSTNEELETAKEELQSSNEELTTLNEELQNRNSELSLANNDLLNLFANVSVPVIIVGNDLRIRRFTPPAEKLLNVMAVDIGRRLAEIRPNLDLEHLEHIARESIDKATLQEREVHQNDGGWYLLRVRPYKTWDNRIDGAVLTFQDIDALKRTIVETRNYADSLIENAREPILVLDEGWRVTVANRPFYKAFQVSPEETEGHLIYELGSGQWNIPKLRELLKDITEKNTRIDDFEVQHDFPHIGQRTMLLNARRIESEKGGRLIVLSIGDISESRRYVEGLRRQSALLELTHETVIVRDLSGKISFWNRGAEETYGWTKQEALGKTTQEVLQTEFPKPWEEVQAELIRTGRWEGELVHRHRDGSRKVVSTRWALLQEEGAAPAVLEICTDLSAQKQYEENLRHLSAYLMRVQDEERRRIARELHDSTGQKLAAMKMSLDLLARTSDPKSKGGAAIGECVALLKEANQEIRTLVQLLHPPDLDAAGLIPATRWLVKGFSERAGIPVDFDAPSKFDRLPQDSELALFRIVQECLTNIHRHSGAYKAEIRLTQAPEAVRLEIVDNGKGMSPDGPPKQGAEQQSFGVGILGMKERLSLLGGRLEISSGKQGTTVRAIIPNHRPS
jgi:two-component system, chemotaxis family, CheB/CheR fusion protein